MSRGSSQAPQSDVSSTESRELGASSGARRPAQAEAAKLEGRHIDLSSVELAVPRDADPTRKREDHLG